MTNLTQAGQGNGPSSATSSPQERGCTRGHNSGSTSIAQTLTMVGVAMAKQPQPAAYPLGVGLGAPGMEAMARVTRGLV